MRMRAIGAWLAWLVPLGVYVASLEGSVGYWDTGEMQTVPWIFGIMHATGFPTYTIAAGIFAHVFAIGAVAWRITLFSALAMSGAAWLVSRIVLEVDCYAWIATAAAWLFAFGETVWTRGTRAEVHALAVFFAMLTLYLAVVWYKRGDARALAGGALAWGLGIATHPIVALLLPALVLLLVEGADRLKARPLAVAVALFALGLSFYAYLPVRSYAVTQARLDPTRALGLAPGQAFWDNDHPSTWRGFKMLISGEEFGAGGTFATMVRPSTYGEKGPAFGKLLLAELTPLGALFAIVGLISLLRRDTALGIALCVAFVVPVAFAFGYTIEADPERYYITAYAIASIFAGFGAGAIARLLPVLRLPSIAALAAIAIALAFFNRATFGQRNDSGARSVIRTVQQKTPADAILLAPWLYATPLAYGSYVEGSLGKRTVVSTWLTDAANRVPGWLRTRPVYVVGELWGDVPGYRIVKIPGSPDLWRVEKP